MDAHMTISQETKNLCVIIFLLITSLRSSNCLQDGDEHENVLALHSPGDIIIGGLFPVHEDGSAEGFHCGAIKPDKGIQRMEAMLYAVDQINGKRDFLHGIKLGVHIRDTCHQDTHALEQTLELIRETVTSNGAGQYTCLDGSTPKRTKPKSIVAIIGAASSQVSAMVANVLRLFKIPQISYSSTSAELSDKTRFGYFSRVVPPDNLQAQAMVDIIAALGWTYVSAIADEGSYGETGFEAFKQHADQRGICIAAYEKVKRGFHDHDFLSLVLRLDKIKAIMKAVHDLELERRFAWLASDNWGTKRTPVIDHPASALGAITIQPKVRSINGFDRYFTSLNPRHYKRNPWFREFWEHEFNCSSSAPSCYDLSLARNHQQEGYVPYVIDAVYTMAHALRTMIANHCGDKPFRACDLSVKFSGSELLQYIRTVNFIGPQGVEIRLDERGDRMGMYDIYQFQGLRKHYESVGKWTDRLHLNLNILRKGYKGGIIPESDCGKPCDFNEFRSQTSSCCWACLPCNSSSIMPNETSCVPCKLGLLPNSARNECIPMIPENIEWYSWWAIGPSIFSSFGILVTLYMIFIFIKYSQVSIIKASGRELCFVMIFGIICSYCMTFPLLHRPNGVTCTIRRIGVGICSCIIYAAILTKTNRVARIFTSNVHEMQNLRFISPKAQLLICLLLISVQLLSACIWIIVEPPETSLVFPNRFTAVLSCKGGPLLFPMSMVYNMMLIVLCTIYAFKTRKIPENFNETKHIGFTMYATCIIWLSFIPIYFGTNDNYKIQTISMCICISLSGTVALCCFFMPKIYILLYQPAKVNRQGRVAGVGRHQLNVHRQRTRIMNILNPTVTMAACEPSCDFRSTEYSVTNLSVVAKEDDRKNENSTLTLLSAAPLQLSKESEAKKNYGSQLLVVGEEPFGADSPRMDDILEKAPLSNINDFSRPDSVPFVADTSTSIATSFSDFLLQLTRKEGTVV